MASNPQGKRITSENLAGQVTTTAWDGCLAYGYNEKSELTNAVAAVDSDYRYDYAFDDIGNRITSLDLGTNRVYAANALNQYSSITTLTSDVGLQTPSFTPQFDLDGNQTLIRTATGIWQVQHNGENRPVLWTCKRTGNKYGWVRDARASNLECKSNPNFSPPTIHGPSRKRMPNIVPRAEDIRGAWKRAEIELFPAAGSPGIVFGVRF